MNKDIYLTDDQYKAILIKIQKIVNQENFKYSCEDSNTIGNKYNISNCGFCNDNFTEKNTALFPDQFPERKSMKYRLKNHKCPFDMRAKLEELDMGYGNGCFYHCYLFQSEKKGIRPNITKIREMVDKTIKEGNK